jgi:cytochrome c551/c552
MNNIIILVSTIVLFGIQNFKSDITVSINKTNIDLPIVTNHPSGQPAPSFKDVEPLLQKYTCIVCHTEAKKLIGPSYKDIAKRNYTDARILQLIYKPEPSNWPDYPAPMVPMTNVKKVDGLKIAAWINSLK